MSQGPIPDYQFNSGVYPQADAHNPVYAIPPEQQQKSAEEEQKEWEVVNNFLAQLPPEGRAFIQSMNPQTYNEAIRLMNQFADEVLMNGKPI